MGAGESKDVTSVVDVDTPEQSPAPSNVKEGAAVARHSISNGDLPHELKQTLDELKYLQRSSEAIDQQIQEKAIHIQRLMAQRKTPPAEVKEAK